jgi:hypothetical protein
MSDIWWLSVFFLIQGEWVPGSTIEGWSPRQYATQAECLERKSFAELQSLRFPLDYETTWICSLNFPLEQLSREVNAIE